MKNIFMQWTSEITNDPDRDYSLVIELLAGEQYIGRLYFEQKKLQLKLYPCNEPLIIPAVWLKEIIDKAQLELKHNSKL